MKDGHGHGTEAAGVAAAATNNGIGIAGVTWNCKIMPVRIGNENWWSSYNFAAKGIKYAADNGANVCSMSFGWYQFSSTLLDAVNYAYGKGVFLCAAVGNSNLSTKSYPAAYDNVTAVAATNQNDKRCTKEDWDPNDYWPGEVQGSNYGDWVDIAAPGNLIYSTMPTYHVTSNNVICPFTGKKNSQYYEWYGGTSSASPLVASVAALLLSRNPSLTPDEIKTLICENVDPYDSEYYIGTGRINAYKALKSLSNNPPDTPIITGKTNGKAGEEYEYCLDYAEDPDGDSLNVWWDWGDGTNTGWLGPYEPGEPICDTHSWSKEGTYTVKAKLKDTVGAESDWATLTVSMPKSKEINIQLILGRFFHRFPLFEKILNQITL